MSKLLLESSDSSDEETKQFDLNLNSDFAKNYDNWRRKEELQKLKDKYGNHLDVLSDQSFSGSDQASDDSDSESDQSIEDNQQVFDQSFFKVYSALKTKNPVIYDKSIKFFDENQNESKNREKSDEEIGEKSGSKEKSRQSMTLIDYHKKLIKEKKGITDEDLEDLNGLKEKPIGYYQELDEIRNEFKSVLNSDDENEELIKGKTEPIPQNKDKNIEFFDESADPDLKYLKNYWKSDKQLEESEKFLRDYIINKRYIDKKDPELYRKPVSTESRNLNIENNDSSDGNEAINGFETSDDKNKDNENEVQISSYHFEEPNSESIKRFPRTVETIRDSTNSEKRAQKRSETKERKKREKERELKRLRKLKREELRQRFAKLQEISANERMDFNDFELSQLLDDENDFDSQKYDQKMQTLFGDNYYENENELSDKSKPKFEFMPEIDTQMDTNEELVDNNDNQYNENESKVNKKLDKKQKKISKTLSELGIFEDLIGGDLGTRYKYRAVESNDFGLTDEEILWCDDKELNKWCSVKKMSQYRDDTEEKYDVKSYANKANNLELKRKILKTFYDKQNDEQNDKQLNESIESTEENEMKSNDKKRKKRKHKKPKFTVEVIGDKEKDREKSESISKNKNKTNGNKRFKKNMKQKGKPLERSPYPGVTLERLKAYGLSNRKIKRIKNKNKH